MAAASDATNRGGLAQELTQNVKKREGGGGLPDYSTLSPDSKLENHRFFRHNYIHHIVYEFLATDTEVSGSIPGATRFSE